MESRSLGVKETVRNCDILSSTIDTAQEVIKLTKYYLKRESMFFRIAEGEKSDEDDTAIRGLQTLCPTRWTVMAACLKRIIDNYAILLLEWDQCLEKKPHK